MTKMTPTGFAYCGIFIDMYAITMAGMITINMTPAKVGSVVTELKVIATIPNENAIPKITKVVAFALLLVEIPPSKIPADRNINPIIIVSPVKACMPSINVWAIPA